MAEPALRARWIVAAGAAMASGCAVPIAIQDAQHVERVVGERDGALRVYSARGMGSFTFGPSALPSPICFWYDPARAFAKLEGFELTRVESGGGATAVAVSIDGACARVSGRPEPGHYRVSFVDYYR